MSKDQTAQPHMDSLRFIQIVQAYGSDPKRWPDAERAAALAFSNRDSAQDILRRERGFDETLSQLSAPEPSDLLKARIMKAAKNAPPIANDRAPFIRRFAAIAAIALVAVTVSLSSGLLGPSDSLEAPLYETADDFLIADLDALWDEEDFFDPA